MRLFIDMDGVLCKWQDDKSIEEVATKGYFASLPQQENVVSAIKALVQMGFEVFILSAVFIDNHSINDKNTWLNNYLPEINMRHRIFVPYGERKSDYIPNPKRDDFLVDDLSRNLHEWHGVGIKMLNGINGTKGTWTGFKVDARCNPETIWKTIAGIVHEERKSA